MYSKHILKCDPIFIGGESVILNNSSMDDMKTICLNCLIIYKYPNTYEQPLTRSIFLIRLRCFEVIVAVPFNLFNFDYVINPLTEIFHL